MRLRIRSHWRLRLAVAATSAIIVVGAVTWMLVSAYEAGLLTGRPPINLDATATDYTAPKARPQAPAPDETPEAPARSTDVPGGVWLPEQGVAVGDTPLHASDFTRPR